MTLFEELDWHPDSTYDIEDNPCPAVLRCVRAEQAGRREVLRMLIHAVKSAKGRKAERLAEEADDLRQSIAAVDGEVEMATGAEVL